MPIENYFDKCANYILEYDLIRKSGVMTEMTGDENQKYEENNNDIQDNNNAIKIENNSKNISVEERLKINLEAKNDAIKNN